VVTYTIPIIRNFYVDEVGCSSDELNADYSTDCNVSENFVTFIYTIRSPLLNNVDFSVLCLVPNFQVDNHITVKGIDVIVIALFCFSSVLFCDKRNSINNIKL